MTGPVEAGAAERLIQNHGGSVRRIQRGVLEIVVQEMVDGEWIDRMTYNEMSSDYAISDSIKYANNLAQRSKK